MSFFLPIPKCDTWTIENDDFKIDNVIISSENLSCGRNQSTRSADEVRHVLYTDSFEITCTFSIMYIPLWRFLSQSPLMKIVEDWEQFRCSIRVGYQIYMTFLSTGGSPSFFLRQQFTEMSLTINWISFHYLENSSYVSSVINSMTKLCSPPRQSKSKNCQEKMKVSKDRISAHDHM